MLKKMMLAAVLMILPLAGCGGSEPSTSTGDTEKTAVSVSAEMQDFISGLNGSYKTVQTLVTKYADATLAEADKDIGDYDLKNGVVLEATPKGDNVCYKFAANAGVTKRGYDMCWKGGKITSITFSGFVQ